VHTRRGRDRVEKLFGPSVTLLENMIGDGTLEYNGAKLEDRRKASQYIIDHNIGRAAFQIHGVIDFHKTELILQAFLAGGVGQLSAQDRALIAEATQSVPSFANEPFSEEDQAQSEPGEVVEHTICDTEATEAPQTQDESADQGAQENDPCGTEPCDASY